MSPHSVCSLFSDIEVAVDVDANTEELEFDADVDVDEELDVEVEFLEREELDIPIGEAVAFEAPILGAVLWLRRERP